MSRKFDPADLHARISGNRAPLKHSREGRVRLLGDAAKQLLASDTEAGYFVGGAIMAYLENRTLKRVSLERDFLKVVIPKSHRTPSRVWAELNPHPDEGEADGTSVGSTPDTSPKESE